MSRSKSVYVFALRSPPAGTVVRVLAALIWLGPILAASCAGPETTEPPRPAPGSSAALHRDLDRQKDATRRRLRGDEEPAGEQAPEAAPASAPEPRAAAPAETPPAGEAPAAKALPPKDPGPPPDWYNSRRHPAYPDSEYLLGVGTATADKKPGVDPQSAEAEAYKEAWASGVADILSQFETHISSEVTTFIQQSLQVRNKEEEARLFHAGSSRTRATVEGQLKGVRPADRYYDPRSGFASVLVAVKRSQYARQVSEDLQAMNAKVQKTVEEAERIKSQGNAFRAYQLYGEAEALVVGCRDLRARIRYAAPGFELPAAAEPPSLGDLFGARKRLTSEIHFLLLLRHDAFGRPAAPAPLEESLMAQLKRFGFNVKLATGKLALKSTEEVVRDLGMVREALGKESPRPLLLVCQFSSEGRKIEGNLLSLRTEGWARLIDVTQEELLLTVTTPTGRDSKPAVGLEEQRSELLKKASGAAAASLAEQLYKQL